MWAACCCSVVATRRGTGTDFFLAVYVQSDSPGGSTDATSIIVLARGMRTDAELLVMLYIVLYG